MNFSTIFGIEGYSNLNEVRIVGTSLGDYAFKNFELKSIIISSSVENIGAYCFEDCNYLESIIFEKNSQLKTIGDYAFYGSFNLKNITIPSSVTSIGYGIFQSCNLESIEFQTFNESIVLKDFYVFTSAWALKEVVITGGTKIGNNAFEGCSNLETITISSSVTSIGSSAFAGCSNLFEVYYKGTEAEWNSISIDIYNDELSRATIYYFSEEEPTGEGNYWHYVNGEITKW